jgi:hypothetical protein
MGKSYKPTILLAFCGLFSFTIYTHYMYSHFAFIFRFMDAVVKKKYFVFISLNNNNFVVYFTFYSFHSFGDFFFASNRAFFFFFGFYVHTVSEIAFIF